MFLSEIFFLYYYHNIISHIYIHIAIEVELRSWVEPIQAASVSAAILSLGAEYRGKESQETWYFDGERDVRIQKSDAQAKMWMKSGAMHDSVRKETEVLFERGDFEALSEMIQALGVKIKVKWIRTRHIYIYGDITISVDHTIGYGDVVEAEILIHEDEDPSESLARLHKLFDQFGLTPQSRDFWDHKYSTYMKNWGTHLNLRA